MGDRERVRTLAYALWMLSAVAAAVFTRDVQWCAAAGVLGLGVRLALAHGRWTPSGHLGVANQITLARLILIALLGILFESVPRFAFVGVVVTIFALDGLDGRVARTRGESSAFGAAFDMETDALGVMVLGLLLWQHGIVGLWVLVAGLWRYVYAAAIAIVPSLSEAPRSRFGRVIYCALMVTLSGAFLPVPGVWSARLAAVGTTLVSYSFLRALRYSRTFATAE